MITHAVLTALFAIVEGFMSATSFQSPSAVDVTVGSQYVANAVADANSVMPVQLITSLCIAGFAFDLSLTAFRLVLKVYSLIPVIGNGD